MISESGLLASSLCTMTGVMSLNLQKKGLFMNLLKSRL